MKLEDEITIVQFAQGHYPEADLLVHFSRLTETDQWMRLHDLFHLLNRFRLTDSDIEQANAQHSTGTPSTPLLIRYFGKAKPGLRINMANSDFKNTFPLLLNLFKKAYNQHGNQEKTETVNWWYWDLSDSECVERIRTSHQERVNELYAAPSFRSEFISLARLWHDKIIQRQSNVQEPAIQEEAQTRFDFISYDGIMEKSVTNGIDKISHAIYILLNSLRKAIAKQYGLDTDKSNQLVLDVMGKYYQDSYTGQYDSHSFISILTA